MGERSVEVSGWRLSLKRLARRQVVALSLAGLVLLIVTAGALAVTGDLTQPAGTAGCVSETGAGPCADGHALDPIGVAVSPDGKSIYVVSFYSNAVARLNRNTTTGAIAQPAGTAGCVSETAAGPCADGHALYYPQGVAVSPDGKSVYVAAYYAVVRLNRNTTTGAISQPAGSAGCFSQPGYGAEPCADGHALTQPNDVAVSPDGKSVYVTSASGVARFTRNTTTGAISQPAGTAGCISETGAGPCADGHEVGNSDGVAVSPNGKNVYAVSYYSVVRLNRNTTTGAISQPVGAAGCVSENETAACADGHALFDLRGVAVSADGKNVYAASAGGDAVARLNRNTTTGAISQPAGAAGCVSEDGTGGYGSGVCIDGHALGAPQAVAVSPDGKNVYVASAGSDAVVRLNRDTTTGAIGQPAGNAGCVGETEVGPCADGHALFGPRGVAVSPNGNSVYVASFDSDAVARFNRAP